LSKRLKAFKVKTAALRRNFSREADVMRMEDLRKDFEENKVEFYRELLEKEQKDLEKARAKEREMKQNHSDDKGQ
jgi:hypothetical protein